MMTCDACEQDLDDNEAHLFSGPGWIVRYHPACCPLSVAGDDCHKEHPDAERYNELLRLGRATQGMVQQREFVTERMRVWAEGWNDCLAAIFSKAGVDHGADD